MARQTTSANNPRHRHMAIALCLCLIALTGCSRRFWRLQAERDTYEEVRSKLNDPHWALPRIDLRPDQRSRFYDPWNPDCEPLPPDDPAAHQSMHCVSGRKGYKNWHKFGTALSIENPQWLSSYGVLMNNIDPVEGHSQVEMKDVRLQQAIDLAYIHSRSYQTAIEDLYLTALTFTQDQFNLGVRYAGQGVRVPGFTETVTDNPGGRDTVGFSPRFGVTQLLPAGTQLAAELANNTLWLFGGGTSSSATTLAFSLTQPLLFQAGRKVVLEAITQADRNVLYSARDLARFRQVLFTGVTTEFLRIQQQLQAVRNLETNIGRLEDQIEIRLAEDSEQPTAIRWELLRFPPDAEIPESLTGVLSYDEVTATLEWRGPMTDEQRTAIRSVSADPEYRAAAAQLIRYRDHQVISQSFAELQTRLNRQRNQLENARLRLADLTDAFKITLGLPPNVGMTLDNSILDQFTLIDPKLISLDDDFKNLAKERGPLVIPESDEDQQAMVDLLPEIRTYLRELSDLRSQLAEEMADVEALFGPVTAMLDGFADGSSPSGSRELRRTFDSESADERQRVREDVAGDRKLFDLNQQDFDLASGLLDMIIEVTSNDEFPKSLDTSGDGTIAPDELPDRWKRIRQGNRGDEEPRTFDEVIAEARDGMLVLREYIIKIGQSVQVVQADLRVELIAINRFVLPGGSEPPTIEEVVQIGISRRHDLMNARAQVMDARRLVEVAANALEATLDVTFNGRVGAAPGSRKPFDFSDTAAQYNAGLRLDTPADKVAERNVYNAALINYQRARRDFMALEDDITQQIRQSWRQLRVSEQQLEIDRQSVRDAGLSLDIAAINATGPGQSNAFSLLNALDAVLAAQNSLVSDWITYEVNRLNIYRDMGIMEVDDQGLWVDDFYANPTDVDASVNQSVIDLPDDPSLTAADAPLSFAATPLFEFDVEDGEQE